MADRAPRRALVFAGGDPPPPSVGAVLPVDAIVIGADSGVEHARRLGRTVDIAVGDFDSVDPAVLAEVEAAGTTVLRHPPDKDASDLELALETAVRLGIDEVTVIGGHGGRVDHFVASSLLLGSDRFDTLRLDAWIDVAHVVVVRGTRRIEGRAGDVLTLLAVGSAASGVRTTGLRYPLDGGVLAPGSTLGLSNVMLTDVADVTVSDGVVLAIRPHALDHGAPQDPEFRS